MFRTWCTSVIFVGALIAAQDKKTSRSVSRGKEIFEQCRGCHNAERDGRKAGPTLKGLFKRPRLSNGDAVNEKMVRARIEQGGDGMPAYSGLLSENDMYDLIAYLRTL